MSDSARSRHESERAPLDERGGVAPFRPLIRGLYVLGFCVLALGHSTAAADEKDSGRAWPMVRSLTDTLAASVGGVTVDALGYVYVADFDESVRRISPWGDLELFARGLYGSSGNVIDHRGNLLQSSFNGNYISRVSRTGEQEIVVADSLAGPVGLALDQEDNLYVCNCSSNSIVKVAPDGSISSLAETDLFQCPNGITLGPDGALYVVSFNNPTVVRVDRETGETRSFATLPGTGGGHITSARGRLFATGFRSFRVYEISDEGDVAVLAGSGQWGSTDGRGDEASFALVNGIGSSPSGDKLYVNESFFIPRPGAPPPRSRVREITLPTLTEINLAALHHGGIESLQESHRSFKAGNSTFTEIEMNLLGYQLLQEGNLEGAVTVFELNVEDYPTSWNAFDSLADGYKAIGDRERAILNYERALELNPEDANAIQMLEELGTETEG